MGMTINDMGGFSPTQMGPQQAGKFGGFGPWPVPGQFGGKGPQLGPPPDIATASQHLITRLDANGDSAIDLASEATAFAQAGRGALLQAADADANGQVTLEELRSQMNAADTNADGTLSHAEARALHTSMAAGGADATVAADTTTVATDTTTVPVEEAATVEAGGAADSTTLIAALQAVIAQLQELLALQTATAGTDTTPAVETTEVPEVSV